MSRKGGNQASMFSMRNWPLCFLMLHVHFKFCIHYRSILLSIIILLENKNHKADMITPFLIMLMLRNGRITMFNTGQ